MAGYELTRDPTLRHQRRLGCVLTILVLHVLLFGGLMGYIRRKYGAVVLGESVYYGYMALSSIGVDSTVPHTPAAVAYVSYYVLAGLGLLTLVAEDVYGLYCVYKAYLDDEEDCPCTSRPGYCGATVRRLNQNLVGSSAPCTGWLNLPRRLSAQARERHDEPPAAVTVCVSLGVVNLNAVLPLLLAAGFTFRLGDLRPRPIDRGARRSTRPRRRRATRPCASFFCLLRGRRGGLLLLLRGRRVVLVVIREREVVGLRARAAGIIIARRRVRGASSSLVGVRSAAFTPVRVVDRQAHDGRVVTITIIFQIKVVRREVHSVGADVVIIIIGRGGVLLLRCYGFKGPQEKTGPRALHLSRCFPVRALTGTLSSTARGSRVTMLLRPLLRVSICKSIQEAHQTKVHQRVASILYSFEEATFSPKPYKRDSASVSVWSSQSLPGEAWAGSRFKSKRQSSSEARPAMSDRPNSGRFSKIFEARYVDAQATWGELCSATCTHRFSKAEASPPLHARKTTLSSSAGLDGVRVSGACKAAYNALSNRDRSTGASDDNLSSNCKLARGPVPCPRGQSKQRVELFGGRGVQDTFPGVR